MFFSYRYTGPTYQDSGSVPIAPIVSSWRSNGVWCAREQLPLVISYAFTTHKAQGVTLDSAVVDPGEKEFQLGLTYVALSRVRSIESLALENSYDFARFSSIGGTNMMRLRKLEEARLRSLSNQIV